MAQVKKENGTPKKQLAKKVAAKKEDAKAATKKETKSAGIIYMLECLLKCKYLIIIG